MRWLVGLLLSAQTPSRALSFSWQNMIKTMMAIKKARPYITPAAMMSPGQGQLFLGQQQQELQEQLLGQQQTVPQLVHWQQEQLQPEQQSLQEVKGQMMLRMTAREKTTMAPQKRKVKHLELSMSCLVLSLSIANYIIFVRIITALLMWVVGWYFCLLSSKVAGSLIAILILVYWIIQEGVITRGLVRRLGVLFQWVWVECSRRRLTYVFKRCCWVYWIQVLYGQQAASCLIRWFGDCWVGDCWGGRGWGWVCLIDWCFRVWERKVGD